MFFVALSIARHESEFTISHPETGESIKAPLMVQHGTNVPVIEAEQVVDNVKKRGVPVEYILFPDEGHGWRNISNRVRSTVALVEFYNA